MSLFHENIRNIFAEFEKFLNETLKKEKLCKKTLEHKQSILDKLKDFYNENPQMRPSSSSQELTSGKDVDESSMTGSSVSEDNASADQNYIDAGIGLISAADLKEPVISGFLEKKQKKGAGLFGGKFQRRWCAIHAGVFYYYATQKDKQQHGSFKLDGYRFRNSPDLSAKKNEKELCFELYHEDEKKRIYQFMAKSKTEYDEWNNIIDNEGRALIEEDMYEEVGMDRPAPAGVTENKPEVTVEPIEEDVYEEPPEGPEQAKPPPPPPSPRAIHKAPLPDLPEVPRVPPPPSLSSIHKPPPAPPKDDIPSAGPDEIYDDALSEDQKPGSADSPPRPPEVPPPGKRGQRPQRDLPPPPPVKKKIKLNITFNPVEDFENRYYGKWDCEGGNSQELSFKKGEIIYILSREFDEKSWWVGELNGKFGLVPKNYLIPAYTPVNA